MELQYFSSGPRERVLDAVLAAGHKVLGVFITDPARWPQVARTVELAARHGIAVRIVRRADLAGLGTELGGDQGGLVAAGSPADDDDVVHVRG